MALVPERGSLNMPESAFKRQLYEVGIFNSRVRKALEDFEPNKTGFADSWADNQYLEVEATDEEAAKKRILGQYPAAKGFVVVGVRKL